MLTIVIVFNVLLSLLCFYAAWQLWNWRRALAIAADAVNFADRVTYEVLHGAPVAITQGQVGVRGMRGIYQQLEIQLQRIQQVLAVLGLVQTVLRTPTRYSVRVRQRSSTDTLKVRSHSRRLRRQQRSRR
jgi:hypothetical protein